MAAATEDAAVSREGRVELPGFEERGGVLKLKDVSEAGQDEGRNSEGEAGRAGGAEKDTEYRALVTLSEWFAVQSLTNAAHAQVSSGGSASPITRHPHQLWNPLRTRQPACLPENPSPEIPPAHRTPSHPAHLGQARGKDEGVRGGGGGREMYGEMLARIAGEKKVPSTTPESS